MPPTTTREVSVVSTADDSFSIQMGAFSVSYGPDRDAVEIRREDDAGHLAVGAGDGDSWLRALEGDTVEDVTVSEHESGATATVSGALDRVEYAFEFEFRPSGAVSYVLSVAPTTDDGFDGMEPAESTAELAFHRADGTVVDDAAGDDVVSYLDGTPGSNSAAGMDDLNQFVFCAGSPVDATVLYLADFTALSPYFERSGTNMRGTVSAPPGRFGFDLPVPETDLPPEETVVLDAALHLGPGAVPIDEPTEYSRRFVNGLAAIYPHLEKPPVERVDWPDITERAARDIDTPHNTGTRDGVTSPNGDIVTTTSIMIPFRKYAREFDADLPDSVVEDAEEVIETYYDPTYDNGSGTPGLVANSPAPHTLTEADSWYFLWPIIEVAEYADAFDSEPLRQMVIASAASAIEFARAVDYVFPMWLNVDECEGDPGDPGDTWHGYQYDSTGAFVYLMERCYDLSGDDSYLEEATEAADRLLEMGFELPYEFTGSATIPLAMLRLAELTGSDRYLDGVYVGLANVLRHSYFFNPQYRAYEDRTIFLLTEAMPPDGYEGELFANNYYANALEEMALIRYLSRFLDEGQTALSPEARELTAELLTYKGTSLRDSVTALADESLVFDGVSPQSGNRAHHDWHLPLEPFGVVDPMFTRLGEIDQITYGAGAYPEMAIAQYNDLGEVTLYSESPVRVTREDEFTHRVEPLGVDGGFEAQLLGDQESMLNLVVRATDGDEPPTTYDRDAGGYRLDLQQDETYLVRREVTDAVVEDLTTDRSTVKPDEEVTVTVAIRNLGAVDGFYPIGVSIGDEIRERDVRTSSGETDYVRFVVSWDDPGTYEVQVGPRRRQVTVSEPE